MAICFRTYYVVLIQSLSIQRGSSIKLKWFLSLKIKFGRKDPQQISNLHNSFGEVFSLWEHVLSLLRVSTVTDYFQNLHMRHSDKFQSEYGALCWWYRIDLPNFAHIRQHITVLERWYKLGHLGGGIRQRVHHLWLGTRSNLLADLDNPA